MIKKESILIFVLSLLITLINGHGYLEKPVSRGLYQNSINKRIRMDEEFSGSLPYRYYYRGGDLHVCGNSGTLFKNGSYPRDTQLTGPVQDVYKSGTQVNMSSRFVFAHGGFFSVKLCKLNSSSDVVSQECLDKESLKIVSTYFYPEAKIVDDYYVYMPYRGEDFSNKGQNMTFTVQLPVGLTCDNCVLLWDWRQGGSCQYSNGSGIRNLTYLPSSDNAYCPYQSFRSCADIKIEPNPSLSSQDYVPNPGKPINPSDKVFFSCNWFNDYTGTTYGAPLIPSVNINTRPDPYKFIGQGLFCANLQGAGDASCDTCRVNCMTPDKVCPQNCYCRWYPKKQVSYQTPISADGWNA